MTSWALGSGAYWRDYVVVSVLGAVVLPLLVTRSLGPITFDALGIRRPRSSLALLAVSYLAALPLALAMAMHPAFRAGVGDALARSWWFGIAVPVGTAAEHFFFHGVLLAWLHPSGAFPSSDELSAPFVWPGLRLENVRASIASLAIPRSCVVPCLLSAPLFFAIHVGKPDAELWLSLPAGVVFAWLAYRTNGFVVPLVLHLSVPATAALLALALSQ
jgi:hypothetical protein